MELGQLLTAMVTPFNQNNEIDFDKTIRLLDHLNENGTDVVVVAVTTGESPTLSVVEQLDLFDHVVKYVNGQILDLLGTTTTDNKSSIYIIKQGEAYRVYCIMLIIHYYNKPSQAGLYEHFKVIAAETILPVMLYNISGRSGCNLYAETTIQLAKIDNIK